MYVIDIIGTIETLLLENKLLLGFKIEANLKSVMPTFNLRLNMYIWHSQKLPKTLLAYIIYLHTGWDKSCFSSFSSYAVTTEYYITEVLT